MIDCSHGRQRSPSRRCEARFLARRRRPDLRGAGREGSRVLAQRPAGGATHGHVAAHRRRFGHGGHAWGSPRISGIYCRHWPIRRLNTSSLEAGPSGFMPSRGSPRPGSADRSGRRQPSPGRGRSARVRSSCRHPRPAREPRSRRVPFPRRATRAGRSVAGHPWGRVRASLRKARGRRLGRCGRLRHRSGGPAREQARLGAGTRSPRRAPRREVATEAVISTAPPAVSHPPGTASPRSPSSRTSSPAPPSRGTSRARRGTRLRPRGRPRSPSGRAPPSS